MKQKLPEFKYFNYYQCGFTGAYRRQKHSAISSKDEHLNKRVAPSPEQVLGKIVFTRRFILFLSLQQTRSFCRDAHLLLCNLS